MPDEIARLSEAMARDPAGLAWVPLAEALRRGRQLAAAERTALRGLERHPYHADGHDVLARIAADGGDAGRARDEWEMALRLDSRHVGAMLGLGWIALQGGDRATALRRWQEAHAIAPHDARVAAVGKHLQLQRRRAEEGGVQRVVGLVGEAAVVVREASGVAGEVASPRLAPAGYAVAPSAARELFATVEQGGAHFALLVDDDGMVLAGRATGGAGEDRSDELGAELSGLSGDADRALRQLRLGQWDRLLVECDVATLALAPSALGSVTLVAASAATPAGLPRLLLDRARRRANDWLEAL